MPSTVSSCRRPRRAHHPAGGATVADDRFLHRQRRPRRPRPFPRRQRNRTSGN
ncbi:hypothetical protein ACPA9J_14090 [Pseudomonas aeruginosa]